MTWNLLHLARMLKDAGGIPAHGNQRSEWDAGAGSTSPTPSTAEAAAAAHPGKVAGLSVSGGRAFSARPSRRTGR